MANVIIIAVLALILGAAILYIYKAKKSGKNVYDALFDIIIENDNDCHACYFLMCEEDLKTVLAHPRSMICTDASVRGNSNVYHPRMRGSFPRALGRYVQELSVTSLPEMIRKMTALPAHVYNLPTKGYIREGYDADINIFDPDALHETGTYREPDQYAEGMDTVLVMGETAIEKGEFSHMTAGRLIRR